MQGLEVEEALVEAVHQAVRMEEAQLMEGVQQSVQTECDERQEEQQEVCRSLHFENTSVLAGVHEVALQHNRTDRVYTQRGGRLPELAIVHRSWSPLTSASETIRKSPLAEAQTAP